MTHPAAMRQEALARVAAGESARSVGRALGIADRTVLRWAESVPEAMSQIAAPIRDRIADDATIAFVRALTKLDLLVSQADDVFQLRDVAYATKSLSDIALDWREGRKGSVVNLNTGDTNTIVLQQLAGASLEQLRDIARGGE